MTHRLTPLLEPRSIAIVGATPRAGSTPESMMRTLRETAFPGPVYPVNPRYEEVGGARCYPSLAELPERVDLAVLSVGDARIEEALAAAIGAGARAAVIFGSCVLAEDSDPPLAGRLSAMARAASLPICGGNSMGFCHYETGLRVNSYPYAARESGCVTYLSQSGSVFGALTCSNHRIGFNLGVSTGRELSVTAADYMDYALERPSTRVIGLFLETVRDPGGFIAALEKAAAREVPVIALKTGRTEAAARMAVSHSGALVGDDMAFDAVCRRHGVMRADTIDELAAAILLMQQPRRPGPGGLATIHESGGEREMIADWASDLGVPFARINGDTVGKLAARLDPGLEPENPCDAFGTGRDFDGVLRDCFAALMADPDTALGVFFLDLRSDGGYSVACSEACLAAFATTDKPVALATNYSAVDHRDIALEITRKGVPVLDGTVPALKAVRFAFALRDWRAGDDAPPPSPASGEARTRWRRRLGEGAALDEAAGLALLADYGIAAPAHRIAETREEAVAAAREIGFPVVMKTAAADIHHKSDVGGVCVGLEGDEAVGAAWEDMAARLGRRVLVAEQATGGGVEMVLGVKRDPQFGPLVMVGAGGIHVEVLKDVGAMLAPAGPVEARAVIDGLAARPLLDGVRGAAAVDVVALTDAVVRLSLLAADLGDLIAELDVNPLLVQPRGVLALDALVVPRATG